MAKRKALPDEIDLHGLRHKPALELVRSTLQQRYNEYGLFLCHHHGKFNDFAGTYF